ncbi:part of the ABC transporter complex znuABC involved in zinc import [Arthrobacter sp. Hiyo8]|nr:part of the ABC transporter complex znuABC involved in zinc import [Arthrobacter sp. Hiyo8]
MAGQAVERGSRKIGYIPQQKSFAPDTPLRARDLVALGVDGHRWGLRIKAKAVNERVDALLDLVGRVTTPAYRLANCPVASNRGSGLHKPLPRSLNSCSATNRCCLWTCTTSRP